MNNLSDWKNQFLNLQNVQNGDLAAANRGAVLSAESAVIVAGPAELGENSLINFLPVGLVQQAQISQNKQVNEIFEIGSRVPFFVPGRSTVRANLSRVMFDGPSLFYALYRDVEGVKASREHEEVIEESPAGTQFYEAPTAPYTGKISNDNRVKGGNDSATANPGFFWGNLGAQIFNRPIGLGFILYDMEGQAYGGSYLEGCLVQTHNMSISASQTVLAEGISLTAKRVRPLNATLFNAAKQQK